MSANKRVRPVLLPLLPAIAEPSYPMCDADTLKVLGHNGLNTRQGKKPPTNYRLSDGDKVTLLYPARVDGYWFDEVTMFRGSWDSHIMLPGCEGIVVRARTPAVHSVDGRPSYFANVDIVHNGVTSRIRVAHDQLKRHPVKIAKKEQAHA